MERHYPYIGFLYALSLVFLLPFGSPNIRMAIFVSYILLVSFRVYGLYVGANVKEREEEVYVRPSELFETMRKDDKNSLMFGRSRDPVDAKAGDTGGNEVLRGYKLSNNLGDQYGDFTGTSFYGGPVMNDTSVVFNIKGLSKSEQDRVLTV